MAPWFPLFFCLLAPFKHTTRLIKECNVVHLSSGDLLRQEITDDTQLGRTVKGIMSRGELVSSAMMVALMKKRMKDHPGKRVLLVSSKN